MSYDFLHCRTLSFSATYKVHALLIENDLWNIINPHDQFLSLITVIVGYVLVHNEPTLVHLDNETNDNTTAANQHLE
jgi:hypothetical protein